jgi:hypothetical protein
MKKESLRPFLEDALTSADKGDVLNTGHALQNADIYARNMYGENIYTKFLETVFYPIQARAQISSEMDYLFPAAASPTGKVIYRLYL